MNDKFFTLKEEKQNRIINAAFDIFSKSDYRRANTEQITKEADISKGLLFHYFGTKKELYLYLYQYACDYVKDKMKEYLAYTGNDYFEYLTELTNAKFLILKDYPSVFAFLERAYSEEDKTVSEQIFHANEELADQSWKIVMGRMDMTRFKDGVDFEKMNNMILWVSDCLYQKYRKSKDKTMEELLKEGLQYYQFIKQLVYKEEYL